MTPRLAGILRLKTIPYILVVTHDCYILARLIVATRTRVNACAEDVSSSDGTSLTCTEKVSGYSHSRELVKRIKTFEELAQAFHCRLEASHASAEQLVLVQLTGSIAKTRGQMRPNYLWVQYLNHGNLRLQVSEVRIPRSRFRPSDICSVAGADCRSQNSASTVGSSTLGDRVVRLSRMAANYRNLSEELVEICAGRSVHIVPSLGLTGPGPQAAAPVAQPSARPVRIVSRSPVRVA